MAKNAVARRRWLGVLALMAALGMLLAGNRGLRLGAFGWLIYWLVCLGFTFLAIGVAFWDALAVQRRLREERRALLQSTLQNIQSEAQKRAPAPSPRGK